MLVKYRPTTSLLNSFFDDVWHPAHEEECELSPRTDILERNDEYVIFAEMPGINKDERMAIQGVIVFEEGYYDRVG